MCTCLQSCRKTSGAGASRWRKPALDREEEGQIQGFCGHVRVQISFSVQPAAIRGLATSRSPSSHGRGWGPRGHQGKRRTPPPTRGGCADVRRECFLSRPNPKPGSQMYTQNLKKSDSNSWARALSLQGTPGLLCALAGIARHCLNSHHPQPQRTLLCRWLRRPVAWVLGPGHQTPVNSVSSNSHGASGGHPHSYAGALRRTSPACPPALI